MLEVLQNKNSSKILKNKILTKDFIHYRIWFKSLYGFRETTYYLGTYTEDFPT